MHKVSCYCYTDLSPRADHPWLAPLCRGGAVRAPASASTCGGGGVTQSMARDNDIAPTAHLVWRTGVLLLCRSTRHNHLQAIPYRYEYKCRGQTPRKNPESNCRHEWGLQVLTVSLLWRKWIKQQVLNHWPGHFNYSSIHIWNVPYKHVIQRTVTYRISLRFVGHFPGVSGLDGTKMSPFWWR